jgi:hypothetical protein
VSAPTGAPATLPDVPRLARVTLALLLVVGCVVAAGCGGDSNDSAFTSCKDVPFSDQQFDGAYDVKASAASCDLAETVAGAARTIDTGADNINYNDSGFNCQSLLNQHNGRPGIDYTCKNGADGAVVKFTRY